MLLTALFSDGDTEALTCLVMDKEKGHGKKQNRHSAGTPVKVATLQQHTQSRGCVESAQETSWSLAQRCTFFGSDLPTRKPERWWDSVLYYHPPPPSKQCVCQPLCPFFQAPLPIYPQNSSSRRVSALARKSLLTNSTPPCISSPVPPHPAGWRTTGPSAVTAR